ncbi:MAG: urea transporter [Desulfovibrionaceae bacterium]|nr:urea transporter [Desulfovibrionaceae bacterium]
MSTTVTFDWWDKIAAGNAVVHFIDVCLRGAGQVMFQNNPLTGLFFLAGIFWGAYAAHMPAVAWGGVLGLVCGTLTAYALHVPEQNIDAGLHGYNGLLVGCALPTFFAPTPLLWGCIVAGGIFSTILMMAVSRMFRTWKVSAMTGPFVIITWFLMLAAYNFANIKITGLPHPAVSMQPTDLFPLTAPDFWRACLAGVSQVFLINNVATGVLFLIGLACGSVWAAVFGFAGSMLAVGTALLLGAGSSAIVAGLFQFSAVLTAIGLGTTFYKPNWEVIIFTFLGTIFTVVAQGALNVVLSVYGIPTLTFPFVIAAWIFLLPNIKLLPATHQADTEQMPLRPVGAVYKEKGALS